MGYTTEFEGRFRVSPDLSPEHAAYLKQFSETRRMKRKAAVASRLADPVRKAAGLPIGEEGAYFVGAGGFMGQDEDRSVVDGNGPPSGQPGLWCQWAPTEDREGIEWNGSEKFTSYVEWLDYLIAHFLKPWGYTVDGLVAWIGEGRGDVGTISVRSNVVERRPGVAAERYGAKLTEAGAIKLAATLSSALGVRCEAEAGISEDQDGWVVVASLPDSCLVVDGERMTFHPNYKSYRLGVLDKLSFRYASE